MPQDIDKYEAALKGKKIPVLTLDHKWHKLFTQTQSSKKIEELAEELNALLKKQGKVNTEIKNIKKLKKKMMDEIVTLMDGDEDGAEKKMEDNKRLIQECNDKLETEEDESLDIPREIDAVNYKLMLATMESCYDRLEDNTKNIDEIAEWIVQTRIALKKNLIKKQQSEMINHELYSYMHDIFGAEVIDIFDMKYNPEEKKPNQKKIEED